MARIFEQGEVTTPDTTEKLASGKSGSPTSNITWANVVTWLNSVLGFLKISSNLSDGDAPTMRTNLDVYSTTEVDDELILKADKTNVLEKDNTTSYTPTSDYHPATKKYVDDLNGSNIPYTSVTAFGSDIASASITASMRGGAILVSGVFAGDGSVPDGGLICTLPSSFPLFPNTTPNVRFISGDSATENVNELYFEGGTRNIKALDGFALNNDQSFQGVIHIH